MLKSLLLPLNRKERDSKEDAVLWWLSAQVWALGPEAHSTKPAVCPALRLTSRCPLGAQQKHSPSRVVTKITRVSLSEAHGRQPGPGHQIAAQGCPSALEEDRGGGRDSTVNAPNARQPTPETVHLMVCILYHHVLEKGYCLSPTCYQNISISPGKK